jgi:hypothetical protein
MAEISAGSRDACAHEGPSVASTRKDITCPIGNARGFVAGTGFNIGRSIHRSQRRCKLPRSPEDVGTMETKYVLGIVTVLILVIFACTFIFPDLTNWTGFKPLYSQVLLGGLGAVFGLATANQFSKPLAMSASAAAPAQPPAPTSEKPSTPSSR